MPIYKYRMFVQARTDLSDEEIAKYESSRGPNGPSVWPWRDTGEILHARRRNTAKEFYRALRQIKPIIKIKAELINDPEPPRRNDDVALRAWRGFFCLCGYLAYAGKEVGDEVKHYAVSSGLTACGIQFLGVWTVNGKPECDKCLAAAVEEHPEMKQYL